MATKRELKAEIVTLRNRVDALAARVAALESRQWTWPVAPYTPDPWPALPGDNPWTYPVVTRTDTTTEPGVVYLGGNAYRVVDGARRA